MEDWLAKTQQTVNMHLEALHPLLKSATHKRWSQTMKNNKSVTARKSKRLLSSYKWHSQALHLLKKAQQSMILKLSLNVYPTRMRLAFLGKAPSPLSRCGQPETLRHILKECLIHANPRKSIWGGRTPELRQMLYGELESLQRTAFFLHFS